MGHCLVTKEGLEGTLNYMPMKQNKEKKCHVIKG